MITFILFILCTFLLAAYLLSLGIRHLRRRGLTAAANIAEGTHTRSISRKADAVVTVRHLLVTWGSDPATRQRVAGPADRPLGTMPDQVKADEVGLITKAIWLLGRGDDTLKMVAGAPIALTDELYVGAGGTVVPRPVASGTYYFVGYPLTAAVAAGDFIEVNHHLPLKLVIP